MLFSIIVPIYNVESYLRRCIESILSQTIREYELILVDDGSPDNCGEICDEYANKDERIKVIHQVNKGLAEARNAGMRIARGEYYLFCDSDDYVGEKWVESFLPFISIKHNNFIFGGYIFQSSEKICEFRDSEKAKKYSRDEFVRLHTENKVGFVWNNLYYADVIKKYNIFFSSSVIIEDLPFNLLYLMHMSTMDFTGECQYYYVQRETETLSKKYYKEGYKKWQEKYKAILNYITSSVTEENRYSVLSVVSTFYLYPFLNSLKNTFDKRNDMKWIEKIRYNTSIVHNDEFQICLKYADCTSENPRYIKFLKNKKYYLAYLYNFLHEVKWRILSR